MSDTDRKFDDTPSTFHGESRDYTIDDAKRSKGIKGHCGRFWWVYLLIFLAIIVIVVPIM